MQYEINMGFSWPYMGSHIWGQIHALDRFKNKPNFPKIMNETSHSLFVLVEECYHLGLVATKPVFGGLGKTQAQTSLPIRAD